MACLLAAAVHDYEHRGLSNDFLVKTTDERAVRYNDKSVNENHHIAAAFSLLSRPECDFLADLPPCKFRRLRSLIIELVLGTDMTNHATIVESFTTGLDQAVSPKKSPDVLGTAVAFVPATMSESMLLLRIAFKCADLGHLALDWGSHLQWVRRLEEEFFVQGDKEKSLHMTPSFLMDRDKPGASETQMGFFDFVVMKLFRALVRGSPSAEALFSAVAANRGRWQAIDDTKNKSADHRFPHIHNRRP